MDERKLNETEMEQVSGGMPHEKEVENITDSMDISQGMHLEM